MSAGVRGLDQRHLLLDRHGPADATGVPVLLVPPPAAPASCYHLREGLSLRDHLVAAGHVVHTLDFGPITRDDRDLGFTRLVDTVLPGAVRAAARDAGRDVVVLGWSIAGTLVMFTLAAHPDLPVTGAVLVGAPFDYTRVPYLWPLQWAGKVTGGRVGATAGHLAGILPAPLVQATYRASAAGRELTRPVWRLRQHLAGNHDRLAHADAIDRFTRAMPAYPGRFFARLWGDLMVRNEVADGRLRIGDRIVDLADLPDVPVLAVASDQDAITPLASAAHLTDLVDGVQLATAPGSHLCLLTGTTAPTTTWAHVDGFLTDLHAPG